MKHSEMISLIPMLRTYTPKAKFEQQEDILLIAAVRSHGTADWSLIATAMPGRTARQCRERWNNYVNPSLNNEEWTDDEDALLLEKFREFGPKRHLIARYFKGRARNKIRNRIFAMQRREMRANTTKWKKVPQPVKESVSSDPFAFLDAVHQDCTISWHTAFDAQGTSWTFFSTFSKQTHPERQTQSLSGWHPLNQRIEGKVFNNCIA
jgi:hypothetical protein